MTEYEIRGNFGEGWEMVTTAATRPEAQGYLRDYRDNDPEHAYRLVTVRTKKPTQPKYPGFGFGAGGGK